MNILAGLNHQCVVNQRRSISRGGNIYGSSEYRADELRRIDAARQRVVKRTQDLEALVEQGKAIKELIPIINGFRIHYRMI